MTKPVPALAIDASEWFVDEAWREHVTPRHWRRLPIRADVAVKLTLARLQEHGARATFFVPAALAFRAPQLLEDVVLAGHEIGLSVRSPWPIDQVPEDKRVAFVHAWEDERVELERVTGVGVHGFSATWEVAKGPAWWHDDLKKLGFDYDATPVRDSAGVAVALLGELAGSVVIGQRFHAWQLDDEQPRLMGLPREVRQKHEAMVKRGADQLSGACLLAQMPIAQSLGLPRRATAPVPVSPEEVARRLAAEDLEGLPEVPPAARSSDPARKVLREVREPGSVPRLAVIVPLKDEAEGIPSLFRELSTLLIAMADIADCEFVLVDDGSTDLTWPMLEKAARSYPRIRLVRHECNRGVAAAIHTGMLATTADWVASIDGDLSYDPMELRAMVPLLEDAEIVTASPYHRDGGVRNVPDWRLFLSRTLSRAYRVLLRSKVATWTSCFRVYRRQSVVHLPIKNKGFLGTAELLVRVLRRGGRVIEHPCVLEARLLGFSKMRVLNVVLDHMRLLVLVALRIIK